VGKARIVYDSAVGAIASQEAYLQQLRTTALTIASASVAVLALFAGVPGVGATAIAAAGTLVAIASGAAVLAHRTRWVHARLSPADTVRLYVDDNEVQEPVMLRDLALHLGTSWDENERMLKGVRRLLAVSLGAATVEVAVLTVALIIER
jgi:hypothetical protein